MGNKKSRPNSKNQHFSWLDHTRPYTHIPAPFPLYWCGGIPWVCFVYLVYVLVSVWVCECVTWVCVIPFLSVTLLRRYFTLMFSTHPHLCTTLPMGQNASHPHKQRDCAIHTRKLNVLDVLRGSCYTLCLDNSKLSLLIKKGCNIYCNIV